MGLEQTGYSLLYLHSRSNHEIQERGICDGIMASLKICVLDIQPVLPYFCLRLLCVLIEMKHGNWTTQYCLKLTQLTLKAK